MTRETYPLHIDDVSAFARALGQLLQQRHAARPAPPGHVELLNLISRTQGQRNWQALRVAMARAAAEPTPKARTADTPLSEHARKALAHFDTQGRLVRWPVKFSVQKLAMWPLWTRFEAKRSYTEREVNAILKEANTYSDHVTLRRELINHRLMSRRSDGTDYRKLPARPDPEARALMTAWRAHCRDT